MPLSAADLVVVEGHTLVNAATAQTHRDYPSVSLLVPVDAEGHWQRRLAQRKREACDRLVLEFGTDLPAGLQERLDEAVETATVPAGARSLAVYVNSRTSVAIPLSVRVRERVVIDDTFATRDLVRDELRKARYWVLALGLDEPRLYSGRGQRLVEVPLDMAGDDLDDARRVGRGRFGRDRSDITRARRDRRLRSIDAAVSDAINHDLDPVIVIGIDPTVSRFMAVTRNSLRLEGPVRRAPARNVSSLAQQVWPSVDAVLASHRHEALHALDRSLGAGSAVTGPRTVWTAARRSAGALLLVEEGFEYAAVVQPDGSIERTVDAAAPGVLDDAIDDIIEVVLAAGGRVELFPDGALTSHGRIALLPPGTRRR
jgi:hypothetical protein